MSVEDMRGRVYHYAPLSLSIVEMQNKPCNGISFVNICDANMELFGAPGTKKRRDIQEYWNNARRRSIQSYCQLLDKWGVTHSDVTKGQLQKEGRCPSEASLTDLDDDTENGDVAEDAEDGAEGGSKDSATVDGADDSGADRDNCAKDDSFADAFSKQLSLGSSNPATMPAAPFAPNQMENPIPTNACFASLPQMSFDKDSSNMWPTDDSPTPSVAYSSDSSATSEARKGTRANPIIIHADLDYSERNFPFDIIHVPRIEHSGWAREGIDIRMAIGIGDAASWEAWMDDSIPELQDHAIMIQGRSRSSDYDAIDSYHRDDKQSDTAAVHYSQMEKMSKDPTRQAMYWRIITPRSMPLDNVILSGDSTQILRNETGVKRMAGEDKDIEVLSYFVNWVVAKKRTGHQISSARKTNLKDAFA